MDTYIYHHGIKGQKWGVRRYQNKDGSLTPKGKKRYSDDYLSAHSGKSYKEMSDDELRRVNNRLNMEIQYKNLTRQKSNVQKAIDIVLKGSKTIASLMGAYAVYKKFGNSVVNSVGNLVVDELKRNGM